jgi:hypothetical protein
MFLKRLQQFDHRARYCLTVARSCRIRRPDLRRPDLVKYGLYFAATIAGFATVILYFAAPYRVPIFDLAVWVIALGYAFGVWGVGIALRLVAEKAEQPQPPLFI